MRLGTNVTWTRLDDRWTERPQLAELSHDVRWHYLSMIQFCSRTERLDGTLRVVDARRCSDVDDPEAAHAALIDAGLVERAGDELTLREIHDHVPPPSVRAAAEQAKTRKRRERAHKAGDHSLCLPEHCPHSMVTRDVTTDVTRDTGTGQDGTGQAPSSERDSQGSPVSVLPPTRPFPSVSGDSREPVFCPCGNELSSLFMRSNGRCNACSRNQRAEQNRRSA